MSVIELKMPKMGESISEATILNWLKKEGDVVEEEEILLEVATDKVDSEVPSPSNGILTEIRYEPNTVVGVGEVIAIIERQEGKTSGDHKIIERRQSSETEASPSKPSGKETVEKKSTKDYNQALQSKVNHQSSGTNDGFYSPLVISIAKKENVSIEELEQIQGTGKEGRVRKSDLANYLKNRKYPLQSKALANQTPVKTSSYKAPPVSFEEGKDRIVEMDRMRKMIADHMVYSKHTSPHVTSYIEVDVTNMVTWRNLVKNDFKEKYQEKLTFTPLFIEAVAKAIQEYPMINVSVEESNIIVHKDINIGMATALPSGNLIVPVVKRADEKNLVGLSRSVNHLATQARNNALKPDEIGGSTFTISNVGTFGSLMGTPIINQPEAAILALGIIKKRPEVMTINGIDSIAIRSMMYLSLSFDHRVIDGYLGGSFLRKVGDELEAFDLKRSI